MLENITSACYDGYAILDKFGGIMISFHTATCQKREHLMPICQLNARTWLIKRQGMARIFGKKEKWK